MIEVGGDMKAKHKTKRGKYHEWITEEGLLKVEGWARDGLTDEQISHNMGIHPSTLYEWRKEYPDISESLKRGKEVIDRQVENALLKRALGSEYEEVKTYIEIDGYGRERKRKEIVKKIMAPDVTAQIFWLKNRKPQEWRDAKDIKHSGGIDIATQSAKVEKFLDDLED